MPNIFLLLNQQVKCLFGVTVDKAWYDSSGDLPEVTFSDFPLTTCSDKNTSGTAEKQTQEKNGVDRKRSFSSTLSC